MAIVNVEQFGAAFRDADVSDRQWRTSGNWQFGKSELLLSSQEWISEPLSIVAELTDEDHVPWSEIR